MNKLKKFLNKIVHIKGFWTVFFFAVGAMVSRVLKIIPTIFNIDENSFLYSTMCLFFLSIIIVCIFWSLTLLITNKEWRKFVIFVRVFIIVCMLVTLLTVIINKEVLPVYISW